jgi:hypothetical protein
MDVTPPRLPYEGRRYYSPPLEGELEGVRSPPLEGELEGVRNCLKTYAALH